MHHQFQESQMLESSTLCKNKFEHLEMDKTSRDLSPITGSNGVTSTATDIISPRMALSTNRKKSQRNATEQHSKCILKILRPTKDISIRKVNEETKVSHDLINGRIWKHTKSHLSAAQPRQPLHPDLTVTSISAVSTKSTSQTSDRTSVKELPELEKFAVCTKCGHCSRNFSECDFCHFVFPSDVKTYCRHFKELDISKRKRQNELAVNNNSKITIQQHLFYGTNIQGSGNKTAESVSGDYTSGGKIFLMAEEIPTIKRTPHLTKLKPAEPECLTISSDEEENRECDGQLIPQNNDSEPGNPMPELTSLTSEPQKTLTTILLPGQTQPDENSDRDQHQQLQQQEEEEDEEEDRDEDEEDEEDEDYPILIKCRSIRIGSFKVHPSPSTFLPVCVSKDNFTFQVPVVGNAAEVVTLTLKSTDIVVTLGHFGRCLPIIFIYTTPGCGITIRNRLRMSKREGHYYDPGSADETQKRIVLIPEIITEEHRTFLRQTFPSNQLQEIDQKLANEILVRSTPNHPHVLRGITPPPHQTASTITRLQTVQGTVSSPLKFPVLKLLTYPPPPQTGGITITSEDLECLNEGEFLNDVIIDFYLKYLVIEKLSEEDRLRTHVFSSFFYPRLTQKPNNRGVVEDDTSITPQAKRHSHVKTWTRHVDIFEKDFIIIPINQNAHWFLAIICFPGMVPKTEDKGLNPTDNCGEEMEPSPVPSPAPSPAPTQSSHSPGTVLNQSVFSGHEDTARTEGSSKDSSSEGSKYFQTKRNLLADLEKPESPLPNKDKGVAESFNDTEDLMPNNFPASPTVCNNNGSGDSSCSKEPCIIIFDSLAGPSRWRIVANLREYLAIEWQIKKGPKRVFDRVTMRGYTPRVPQQTNFSDCGVYLLQYVESFFEKPLQKFGSPLPNLEDWFPEDKVMQKREDLRTLILSLQKQQQQHLPSQVNSGPSVAEPKDSDNQSSLSRTSLTGQGDGPIKR